MYKFIKFQKEDYSILETWYNKWLLPHTPLNWIPDTTYFVYKDDSPICCGSIFKMSNTPLFYIEGIISDLDSSNDIRKEALDFFIKNIIEMKKELGFEVLVTSTPRDGLMKLFKDNNFSNTIEQYYHLARLF